MKKHAISINLLELQGACRATIKGRDCIVIKLDEARAKPHNNGKVYLSLDVIERRDGADTYGNTHFVCEPVSKAEREGGMKLPILGNGKEFGDMAEVKKQAQRTPPRQQRQDDDFGSGPISDGMEDDDIPF